jgi:hypothetical protein
MGRGLRGSHSLEKATGCRAGRKSTNKTYASHRSYPKKSAGSAIAPSASETQNVGTMVTLWPGSTT